MEIRKITQAYFRKWWLVTLFALLGGIIGYFLYIYSAVTTYEARATLFVFTSDKVVSGETLSTGDLNLSQQLLTQYSGFFYSKTMAEEAMKDPDMDGFDISVEQLSEISTISTSEESNLLMIYASSEDSDLSIAAVNAMSTAFVKRLNDLTQGNYIGVLDRAYTASIMANNGKVKALMVVLAFIVVAFGIIYLLIYFDATVRSVDEIEQELKVRVIGIIPDYDVH